jgi:type I restriction enzyme, S subunit
MQSEAFRNRFFSHETGNVGQGNVGMRAITLEPILLPPLAEQQRIVAEVERHLSVIEELEATMTANLRRAERLRRSILHNAFTGKL